MVTYVSQPYGTPAKPWFDTRYCSTRRRGDGGLASRPRTAHTGQDIIATALSALATSYSVEPGRNGVTNARTTSAVSFFARRALRRARQARPTHDGEQYH